MSSQELKRVQPLEAVCDQVLLTENQLHGYQAYCVQFLEEHPQCALFLDCGLGKTIITLTAISHLLYDSFEVSRLLGKIPNTLILAETSENDSIVRISGRKDLKKYGVTKIENVCANLAPHGLYAYISVSEGKKTAILIECDELFYLAVSERINMKKFAKKDTDPEETED